MANIVKGLRIRSSVPRTPGYDPPKNIQGVEEGCTGNEDTDKGEDDTFLLLDGNEFAKNTTSSRACSVVRNFH